MKKSFFILSMLLFGVMLATYTSCEEDPVEACEQDEICEGEPEVTLCCTDGEDCYWTYNGDSYPDTDAGVNSLYDNLGCASSKKSASYDQEKNEIIIKLLALRDRVIEKSQR
ncbi:MAG: hypothetical protein GQ564_18610 [Bacteroidales bacterium]|nr:hypothetical protein [Bacteroidales bacterium]